MRSILAYPNFEPISTYMYGELHPFLVNLEDGISEFTFLALLLYQKKYSYEISALSDKIYIVTGKDQEGFFFCILGDNPNKSTIMDILSKYKRWKHISQAIRESNKDIFDSFIPGLLEDRDNEDYVYLRESLASLAGNVLHKKRNLANNFEKMYDCEVKPLDVTTVKDARYVLEEWQKARSQDLESDYEQCCLALSLLAFTEQVGYIVYANSKPVGWALGEYLAHGTMFVVHFEKGLDEYKGVYQYVNRATARSLPSTVTYINREQDLGDRGLRQAKLTYRPISFVHKYQYIVS